MSTVVPMPTGRERKRRLRQVSNEPPDSNRQEPAPKVRRRWLKAAGRRALAIGGFVARLFAHVTLSGVAVLVTLASRLVFFFAGLAFIALAALTLIELARNWQDMAVFTPMATTTGALVGVYILAELLVRGIRHLQYRVHP